MYRLWNIGPPPKIYNTWLRKKNEEWKESSSVITLSKWVRVHEEWSQSNDQSTQANFRLNEDKVNDTSFINLHLCFDSFDWSSWKLQTLECGVTDLQIN